MGVMNDLKSWKIRVGGSEVSPLGGSDSGSSSSSGDSSGSGGGCGCIVIVIIAFIIYKLFVADSDTDEKKSPNNDGKDAPTEQSSK